MAVSGLPGIPCSELVTLEEIFEVSLLNVEWMGVSLRCEMLARVSAHWQSTMIVSSCSWVAFGSGDSQRFHSGMSDSSMDSRLSSSVPSYKDGPHARIKGKVVGSVKFGSLLIQRPI